MTRTAGFDVDDLRLRGITALLARSSSNPPRWLYAALRNCLPNVWLPEIRYLAPSIPIPVPRLWLLVTRAEDVVEVLNRHDDFNVTMGPSTRLLNDGRADGTNFILGMDGGADYRWQLRELAGVFRREDVATRVVPIAVSAARAAVAAGGGRIDAIQSLITGVALTLCERYYGVDIDDPKAFSQWTVALSGYLFGPPFDRPRVHDTTLAAATLVRAVVDRAIERAIEAAAHSIAAADETVLARLARVHLAKPEQMTKLVMRSFMMGMIVGFVPTNTIAAGHILDTLLSRPSMLSAARDAAACGDDDLLARTLFEAMRFRPLNPGPWRVASRDVVLAEGTSRKRRVKKGRFVLASTQSAMFDPRAVESAGAFDPARPDADSMVFGYGLHWCAGIHIARAHVTQALKPLLLRDDLRRARGTAGRLALLGLMPEHLFVEYGADTR